MNQIYTFFATVPIRMESILVEELQSLGADNVKETRAGASFEGTLELAYRVCLWSRIANRVLFPIARFRAETPDQLYEGIRGVSWEEHCNKTGTIAVDFHSIKSHITHTKYGALKAKDGIVDYFRDKTQSRPSIDLRTPDIRINVFVMKDQARVSIDLSGESLHRRGYRTDSVLAPLKENLAAALLMKAGWREKVESGGGLIDPMCGSGTFLIEAAFMAADAAPGLLRDYFGFLKWNQHSAQTWDALIDEAEEREQEGFSRLPPIIGYDADAGAVTAAIRNVEKAGMAGLLHIEKRELADCFPTQQMQKTPGLVIVNPPYGKRMGELSELKDLYSALGRQLKTRFQGWKAGMLTGNPDLGKAMGIRARAKRSFLNGAIPCEFLLFDIDPKWFIQREHDSFKSTSGPGITPRITSLAEPFANRIRKNARRLKPWLKRESITAYRLYDQDLPEFAVAVDVYEQWVHVQEYEAPQTVDPKKAKKRLKALLAALPLVLDLPPEHIFLKVRRQQRGVFQYEKQASEQKFHQISEGGCRFLVNFTDYLDTGLFLDHRLTRKMLQEAARGRTLLNLFAYTGSVSVYAAKGGAKSTTNVDLSGHYLDWARRNLALNGFSMNKHRFIAADCMEWLEKEKNTYDLIFLDPPTFSNSKKLDRPFSVQRDYGPLIKSALNRLAPKGEMIFSTNFRKFKMDKTLFSGFHIEDLSAHTIPFDFKRRGNIHKCWRLRRS